MKFHETSADPEGEGGQGGPDPPGKSQKYRGSEQHWSGGRGDTGVRTPLENHKNIGFLSNTGPDPLTQSYQASIQCWAIISPPAKRHFNGVSLAGR